MTDFELHPRLLADTVEVDDLPLCRVRLMNDAQYPWCVLVPRRDAVREIHALSAEDQQELMREIALVSSVLAGLTNAFKMNVGALGNVVPQLHVHVIARFENDAAWPGPVWGKNPPVPYEESVASRFAMDVRRAIARDER